MSTETNTDRQRRRAARVWLRMDGIFGARWQATRGEVPPAGWVAGIAMLTDAEVYDGLQRTVHDWPSSNGPPDWPEFRDLCRPPDQRNAEQRAFDARVELEAPEPMGRLPSPEDIRAQREREPEEFDRKVIEGCNRILGNMRIAENYADWRASVAESARRKP